MVLGFIKSLKEAIQEGAHEAAHEIRDAPVIDELTLRKINQELTDRLATLSGNEIFVASLSAPLREVFINDLSKARKYNRPAYYSCSMDVPDNLRTELLKNLKRDFQITNKETLTRAVIVLEAKLYAEMTTGIFPESAKIIESIFEDASTESLPNLRNRLERVRFKLGEKSQEFSIAEHKPSMALWVARLCYMTTIGAGLGFITKEDVYDLTSGVLWLGWPLFISWQDFGKAYLEGEKNDLTNKYVVKSIVYKQVNELLTRSRSPWLTHPWPRNCPSWLSGVPAAPDMI